MIVPVHAGELTSKLKQSVQSLIAPQTNEDFKQVKLSEFAQFNIDVQPQNSYALPIVRASGTDKSSSFVEAYPINGSSQVTRNQTIGLNDAIKVAIQRHPEITQTIASLAAQNANIDVAKAGYYPQLSGGVSTGDFTSGERGRQVLRLDATQMLYDFGKIKSNVNKQEAGLYLQQADVLVNIDNIALQVAQSIINVKRYQDLSLIAQQQLDGLKRVAEIARLRANAGISSEADPVQAQSYVESAESTLIEEQTLLAQYQQSLNTLLGTNVSGKNWEISEEIVRASQIYTDPEYNKIPQIIAAQAEIEVARADKESTQLSRYPTINLVGSLSQAVNGVNPNNNKDNGLYSSIMIEATSNFYQGGALSAQNRAASYAEEAARAKLNSAYLDIQDQIRLSQEQIEHKQRQISVLTDRQKTTVRTRELYQEQYKLGTRSVVDLLNAEQAIHTANMALISARYDIYSSLAQYISATGRSRDVYGLNNISIQGFEVQQ